MSEAINVIAMCDDRMSSRVIAELIGKEHKHVMRDIRGLLEQGVGESNFGLSSYKSEQNKELPEYQLTKKGCLILSSGYDAVLREKIINRWEELENQNHPKLDSYMITDPIERAKAWIREEEEKQLLIEANNQAKAKLNQAQNMIGELYIENTNIKGVIAEDTTLSVSGLAKSCDFKIGPNRLMQFLRDHGVLCMGNKPNQRYINNGWMDYKANNYGTFTPIVRYKGIVGITQMLVEAGIPRKSKDIPVNEDNNVEYAALKHPNVGIFEGLSSKKKN